MATPEADRERRRKNTAAWRAKNPDRARAVTLKWQADNRERHLENGRRWHRENPSRRQAHASARRARVRCVKSDFTSEQWTELVAEFGGRCAYCGRARRLTREHLVPIAAGGAHDRENVVPACLSCNSSKRERSLVVWLALRIRPL